MKLFKHFFPFTIPIILLMGLAFNAAAGNTKSAYNFNEIKMFSTFLFAANGNIADGNRVVFDEIYSNAVDRYDAKKMTNPGENFGLSRDGYTLAVEARQPISNGDTLHYKMTNLLPQTYTVNIEVQYLQNTPQQAEWVDRFTGERRLVDLTANSTFNVEVTANPASRAVNRFFVVFKASAGVLPVKFTAINCQLLKNSGTQINWTVASEENLTHYNIEKSVDGKNFYTLATQAPELNKQKTAAYSYQDLNAGTGAVYYRLAAMDLDGKRTYSPIKMVQLTAAAEVFTIVNPVQQKQLQVNFKQKTEGKLLVNIFRMGGRLMFRQEVHINANATNLNLPVNNLLSGRYLVTIQNGTGQQQSKIIIIE